MRRAPSKAVSSRIDTQNTVLALAQGLIWCVAAFVVVGNGWSF
jgi:hypothetical protein